MNIKVIAQTPDLDQYWALLSDDGIAGDLRLYTWPDHLPLDIGNFNYLCLVEDLEYQEETDIYEALRERGIGVKEKTFRQVSAILAIKVGMEVREPENIAKQREW